MRPQFPARVSAVAAVLCVGLLGHADAADTVTVDGKPVSVEVVGVTDSHVQCREHEPIPRKDVSSIAFDRFDVVAKQQGILLRDGTRLSGVLRRTGVREVTFRSTSLGLMAIPRKNIAAATYRKPEDATADLPAPGKDDVVAVLENGVRRRGSLLAWTPAGVVLRTDSGPATLSEKRLAAVVFAKVSDRTSVVLRNGDRIAFPVTWKGQSLTVNIPFAETDITLNLDAVKTVQF